MADKMLSSAQISVFCSSMSMMLHSGVPIGEAVGLFAEDNHGPMADVAKSMSLDMEVGEAFAAVAEKSEAFPAYALGVFRTAEDTGRLDEALDRLGDFYQRQHELGERLKTTIAYPVALLLLMCGVLSVLVFAVLPMFQRVYTSLTGSLVSSAYAYVTLSSLVGRVALVLAVAVAFALLALVLTMRTDEGRKKLQSPLENASFTKNAIWLLAVSQLADTLSTLLASGTTPDDAMHQALELAEHDKLKEVLPHCIQDMDDGESLEETLFRRGVFPALYGRMLVGGGKSGNLERVLARLSDRLGRDAEDGLCGVIDATEPVLIGFLTVAVGLTLLSVMLPLLGILAAV